MFAECRLHNKNTNCIAPCPYVNQCQCSRIKSVTPVSLCDVGPPFVAKTKDITTLLSEWLSFLFLKVAQCVSALVCYTHTLNNCKCYI